MKDKQKVIDTFIYNVNIDDAHEHVEITAQELLSTNEEFPIIHDSDLFIDCLIAYFESVEKYELCSELSKQRERLEEKLIPLPKFLTKHHETLRNFGRRNRGTSFDNDDLFEGL